ncbi:MAG: hypothetical protein NW207_01925 [Cytophagales bacterium]|nr:hypothetical protein [Cytophagales bacterium]
MPLIKLFEPENYCVAGVWKIEEDLAYFDPFLHNFHECFTDIHLIKYPNRRLEYIAARFLLFNLCIELGIDFSPIIKQESGKPIFKHNEVHFSLSHSYQYVTAILHLHKQVGIDIEKVQQRFVNLQHKFLSDKDIFERDITSITVAWTIKECVFKLYSHMKLNFKNDIFVLHTSSNWSAHAAHSTININLMQIDDFVLCYAL